MPLERSRLRSRSTTARVRAPVARVRGPIPVDRISWVSGSSSRQMWRGCTPEAACSATPYRSSCRRRVGWGSERGTGGVSRLKTTGAWSCLPAPALINQAWAHLKVRHSPDQLPSRVFPTHRNITHLQAWQAPVVLHGLRDDLGEGAVQC